MNLFKIKNYENIIENPLYINTPKSILLKDFLANYIIMQILICISISVVAYITLPIILIRVYAQIDYIKAWKISEFSVFILCVLYLMKMLALLTVKVLLSYL